MATDYVGIIKGLKRRNREYSLALERRKKQVVSFNKLMQEVYHRQPELYNEIYKRFES